MAPMTAAIHRPLRGCGSASAWLFRRCLTSFVSLGMVTGAGGWVGFEGVAVTGSAIALAGEASCEFAFVTKVGRGGSAAGADGVVDVGAGAPADRRCVGEGGRVDVGLRAAAIWGRSQAPLMPLRMMSSKGAGSVFPVGMVRCWVRH